MELKTEDFLRDRDTVAAKQISNRFDNLLDDEDRRWDSRFEDHSIPIREEEFLLNEAERILDDERATRVETAFALVVSAIVRERLISRFEDEDGEIIGFDAKKPNK